MPWVKAQRFFRNVESLRADQTEMRLGLSVLTIIVYEPPLWGEGWSICLQCLFCEIVFECVLVYHKKNVSIQGGLFVHSVQRCPPQWTVTLRRGSLAELALMAVVQSSYSTNASCKKLAVRLRGWVVIAAPSYLLESKRASRCLETADRRECDVLWSFLWDYL